MKSETILMINKFFIHYYIKIHCSTLVLWLIYPCMILQHYAFGCLEDTGSLSYEDLPNTDTFHYSISKHHIVNIINILIRKDREAIRPTVVDISFLNFYFLLKSSNFIIGKKQCQLFSPKWQTHFVPFQENFC